MTFVKFENQNSRFEDRITITTSNSFGYPRKFFNENNINQFKYVVLYFDPEQKNIGFLFTNDEQEKHKYSIIKSKQGYGGSIVATSFFKTNNIDPRKYHGKYNYEKTNLEGVGELFVIKLKERDEPKLVEPAQSAVTEAESINPTSQ